MAIPRKKDWSLIDAQMKMRDSQDRQGRFANRIGGGGISSESIFANRVAHAERALDPGRGRVRRQAMSRPSNTQQRRKAAGSPETGLQPGAAWGTHGPSQAAINVLHDNPRTFDSSTGRYSDPVPRKLSGPPSAAEVDWTAPDALSLMNPEVATTTIRGAGGRQHDEWRERGPNLSNPYRNEYPTHPKSPRRMSAQAAYRVADDPMGREHRQASTQAAYHLADSAPLKDYKPRGKTVRNKNIQAFY